MVGCDAPKPIELTGEQFVQFLHEQGEVPPLVPVDKYDHPGPCIKRSGLLPYQSDGIEIDVLVFVETRGLCLVSPRIWEALGGER